MLAAKLLSGMGEEEKLYVDDVFSAYTYTGNGSAQTINNGIGLAGKGGLVWTKNRSQAYNHYLNDSERNAFKYFLRSDAENGQSGGGLSYISGVSATGYSLGNNSALNQGGESFVSWTFRRAPKFFDVLYYTGNGYDEGQLIPHGLGVAPGIMIVKSFSNYQNWNVYHRSLGATNFVLLNSIDTQNSGAQWYNTTPTASSFTAGTDINGDSTLYIAYLFAHDPSADGFIQCGTYTGNGSATGPIVNLGWEPQYLMIKNASGTGNWQIIDSMRGMPVGSAHATLQANLVNTESSVDYISPTATGFQITSTSSEVNTSGSNYIYLAIRRPNKPPTTGTKVYNAIARTGTGAAATVTGVGFAPDLVWGSWRGLAYGGRVCDRLRGFNTELSFNRTSGEVDAGTYFFDTTKGFQNGFTYGANALNAGELNGAGVTSINHFFRRAPGFMDVVCYTGDGAARTVPHSLGVAPELMIVKERAGMYGASWWLTYATPLGNDKYVAINSLNAPVTDSPWDYTTPTSSVFSLTTRNDVNGASTTFVAYLFATLPGISKVGSYTGNSTTQTINCGFTTGARFILIKRTDAAGDWYVWDTARGIIAGNDPHLSLNTTAAEVTTDDSVDPAVSGFIVNQVAATDINVSGGQYIFLAIA